MANNALDNCFEQIIGYDGTPGTQVGTGYASQCAEYPPCVSASQRRDCNCNCLFPDDAVFGYETSCGCYAGGLCAKNCDDGLITNPLDEETYCISDQQCPEESIDPEFSAYSKPSFGKQWLFEASQLIGADPTYGAQLQNYFNGSLIDLSGPHDINTVFYFNVKVNNVLVQDFNHTIFAVINNELRGISTINQIDDIYYGYLDVVWKQEQEVNQIIEVFVHDGVDFWKVNQFRTPDQVIVPAEEFLTNAEYYEF